MKGLSRRALYFAAGQKGEKRTGILLTDKGTKTLSDNQSILNIVFKKEKKVKETICITLQEDIRKAAQCPLSPPAIAWVSDAGDHGESRHLHGHWQGGFPLPRAARNCLMIQEENSSKRKKEAAGNRARWTNWYKRSLLPDQLQWAFWTPINLPSIGIFSFTLKRAPNRKGISHLARSKRSSVYARFSSGWHLFLGSHMAGTDFSLFFPGDKHWERRRQKGTHTKSH